MNGLQIYFLGCLLAYPIAVYVLKILNEPKEEGWLEESQKIFKSMNFHKSIKFYYNLTLFMMVALSWNIVIIWLYLQIKALFYIIRYYLSKK
jgi:hypothetical protein